MSEQEEAVEVTTPAGSLKVRGTDIVNVLSLLGMFGIGFFVYAHADEAKKNSNDLANALKEVAAAQREANKAQKLLTCIVSRPESERKKEFESNNSFCQQISRP